MLFNYFLAMALKNLCPMRVNDNCLLKAYMPTDLESCTIYLHRIANANDTSSTNSTNKYYKACSLSCT